MTRNNGATSRRCPFCGKWYRYSNRMARHISPHVSFVGLNGEAYLPVDQHQLGCLQRTASTRSQAEQDALATIRSQAYMRRIYRQLQEET